MLILFLYAGDSEWLYQITPCTHSPTSSEFVCTDSPTSSESTSPEKKAARDIERAYRASRLRKTIAPKFNDVYHGRITISDPNLTMKDSKTRERVVDLQQAFVWLTKVDDILSFFFPISEQRYGGRSSSVILPLGDKTGLPRFLIKAMVLSNDRETRKDLHPGVSVKDTDIWAYNIRFSSLIEEEIANLYKVNHDPALHKWHQRELKHAGTKLKVALVEKIFKINEEHVLSVMHHARGASLHQWLYTSIKRFNKVNLDNTKAIFSNFGHKMAMFHATTRRGHLDLHIGNVFFSQTKNQFTLIDNGAMALSIDYSHKPDILAFIFAVDREYFTGTIPCFFDRYLKEHMLQDIARLCIKECDQAFRKAYEHTFRSSDIPYVLGSVEGYQPI